MPVLKKSDAPEFHHAKSLLSFVRERGWDLYVQANGAEMILAMACKCGYADEIPPDVIDSIAVEETTQKIVYLLLEENMKK